MTSVAEGDKQKVFVGFHVERPVLEALRELAETNDRTVAAEVRLAVRAHLKAAEKAA